MSENDIPRNWYNINADSPVPPTPVLHPGTKEPVTPDFLSVLFPMEIILQEISTERYIQIPDEVREAYKLYRPTPLIRALRLEKALGTPAHIYYKYEGVSPSGSHKSNTALAQAYYNKVAGTKALTTETGAGQWGTALSMACKFFDIDLEVYMVKVSYNQKPYRRFLMETYGAQVYRQPHRPHPCRAGRILAQDPEQPRLAGHRHLGSGRSGRHLQRREEILAGLGAQPRPAAPDGDRRGSRSSRWIWPASIRTWSSAAWAAAPTSAGSPCPSCAKT